MQNKLEVDKFIELLASNGIYNKDEQDAFITLFVTLGTMARDLGYCLTLTSEEKEITGLDKFYLNLKCMSSGGKYDLKKMMAIMSGLGHLVAEEGGNND